mgnify:CR=1 FL=1
MSAPRASSFIWYAVAALLVALYVNMFALWRGLSHLVGDAAVNVPYAVTLSVLACLGVAAVRTAHSRPRTRWAIVLLALICAGIGLLATDPDFPSKRIHVPQYIALALVVRRGLCSRLSGWPLTILGWAITVVLGCHDELVQGFHPQRTFGLVDVLTNAWGAAAGASAESERPRGAGTAGTRPGSLARAGLVVEGTRGVERADQTRSVAR